MKQGCNSELRRFQHKPRRDSEPAGSRPGRRSYSPSTIYRRHCQSWQRKLGSVGSDSRRPLCVFTTVLDLLPARGVRSLRRLPLAGPRLNHEDDTSADTPRHTRSAKFPGISDLPLPFNPPKDFAQGAIPGESQRQMYILLLCLSACDCE